MNNKRIVLVKNDYQEDSDFWEDISKLTDVLTKHGYDVLFKYDDVGVYTIDYAYNPEKNAEFGAERFMEITQQQQEKILAERECQENQEKQLDE